MDSAIVQYAHAFIGRSQFIDGVAIFSAAYLPYGIVLAFVVMLFTHGAFLGDTPLTRKKKRLEFVLMVVISLLVAWGLIVPLIHYAYGRPRPFAEFNWTPLVAHEADPSFPSGHAVFFFVLAVSMWQLNRKWGQWFAVAAALNALARVYALVHFPSDVIYGALIGSFVVFLVRRVVVSTG